MNMHNNPSEPSRRGLWIAFFGPDGAGKSAVIEELSGKLETSFVGITRFHFRPRFRRQGVDWPPVTSPHAQPPRSILASLGKLVYWLLDCWFGYLVTIRPGMARSELVIFDRYLPDILVDPRRYRLPASCLRFAWLLVTLAPGPGLCILLDLPAEVVQQRKQEVSPEESQRQRAAYLSLFKGMPNTLIVDAGCPVDEIAHQVITAIYTFFINSSSQSPEASLIANL